MTIKIEELPYLADATDAESDAVKGGYAALVAARTGNLGLASRASGIVYNKSAYDQSVINRQAAIGVPADVIGLGVVFAINAGGRYTLPVTAAKLEG
jgi:hypothetical protein